MSEPTSFPLPAKLVVGILASNKNKLAEAKRVLEESFGLIEAQSDSLPFSVSNYYCDEMGETIWRQFVSFKKLVENENLAQLKLLTNALEKKFLEGSKRKVNLDCGILNLEKLVVPTTKPGSYRIYLRDGIYAQLMLTFEKGSFRPLPWTYEDFCWQETLDFFNQVRKNYKTEVLERV